jgi:LysR family transcriptional regulator, transcriptional activator for dmlA
MPAHPPAAAMAVLITVADTGSFTQAARRHAITPSGVSKLVARLEHQLGVRLVQRSTRRLTLTDDGARYCARARTILADLADLEREMASRRAEPSGLVRLSTPLLLGEVVVLPAVLAFQRRHPRVRVDLEASDRVVDFTEEPLDIAIRMAAEPPPAAVARRVGADRRVLCASPAYLRARGAQRALADHDCIAFSGRRAGTEWSLRSVPGGEAHERVEVRGRLRCNNIRSVHAAALAGMGVANLPLYLVRDDLEAGRLVAVLDDHVPADRSIYVVYPATRYLPTAVRALAGHLVDSLAGSPLFATELPPRKGRSG